MVLTDFINNQRHLSRGRKKTIMKFLSFMLSTPGRWITWVLTYSIFIPLVMWMPWIGYAYIALYVVVGTILCCVKWNVGWRFFAETTLGHLPPLKIVDAWRRKVAYYEVVNTIRC